MTATVIIITKNQHHYLERSLPVIAAQMGVPGGVETVVVDDDSTDSAKAVVRDFGVRLIEYPIGPFNYARAYNTGAAAGTGQYIVRLSGDAVPIGTDWLASLLAPLRTDPTVGVTWGAQRLPADLRNPMEHLCQRLYAYDRLDAPPRRITRTITVLGCNMATRRDLWSAFPFPELPQAEDYAYFHALIRHGIVGTFVPGAVVLHGHEESLFQAMRRSFEQSGWQAAILLGVAGQNRSHNKVRAQ